MPREMPSEIGGYTPIRKLGSGGYGEVYLVTKNNREYALKQLMPKGFYALNRFFREAMAVNELRQKYELEYVIKIEDILMRENAYVMEYLPQGSKEYISKTQDHNYLMCLVQGVNELHKMNVAHRDIKPENIRVRGVIPVIADFGAASWQESFTETRIGTKFYMPPETYGNTHKAARDALAQLMAISGATHNEKIKNTKKLHDVFSLGITTGELLTQTCPYNDNDLDEYLNNGKSYSFDHWLRSIPKEFREFVREATTFNPLDRPFLDELIKKHFKREPINVTIMPESAKPLDLESEMPYICLDCGDKTETPAKYCSQCSAGLRYLAMHIIPASQEIMINSRLSSIRLIRNSNIHPYFSERATILIDLSGKDFEAIVGRDNNKEADIKIPEDICLGRVQGRLENQGEEVRYFEKENPTNRSRYNNFPVDSSGVKLESGGELILGTTLFSIQKYFTEKILT